MSYYSALTGLNSATSQLSVTSNNIANVSTNGFKRSRAEFGDFYASSISESSSDIVGQGSKLKQISQEFTQGSIETSGNSLDLAITGQGFFPLKSPADNNQLLYTRNGSFSLNDKNEMTNSAGQQLMVPTTNGTGVTFKGMKGQFSPMTILPRTTGQAKPTSTIDLDINLPADAPVIDVPFSRTNPLSYNHSTSLNVYDANGTAFLAKTYYAKTKSADAQDPTNHWSTHTYIGNTEIKSGEIKFSALPAFIKESKDGNSFKVDGLGNPIEKDPDGNPIISDKNGTPLTLHNNLYYEGIKIDSNNGEPIPYKEGAKVAIDPDGNLTIDNSGNPTLDPKGKQIAADKNGNPILDSNKKPIIVYTDNNKKLFIQDAYNEKISPILADQNENKIIMNEFNVKTIPPKVPIGKLDTPKDGIERVTLDLETGPLNIKINYSNVTCKSTPFAVNALRQNGSSEGDLTGVSIADNGEINASYSNGTEAVLGTINLVSFQNVNGLVQVGDSTYKSSDLTGEAQIAKAGDAGLGTIRSGAQEKANVDLTHELIDLIAAQRNFQANAKAIESNSTIEDSIIQKA